MANNRTTLYLGLAAAGAGGYYLYRAGEKPQTVGEEVRGELVILQVDNHNNDNDKNNNISDEDATADRRGKCRRRPESARRRSSRS